MVFDGHRRPSWLPCLVLAIRAPTLTWLVPPPQVGSALLLLILENLNITHPDGTTVPAFRQETAVITRQNPVTKLFKVHKQGHLVADPEVVRQLEENKEVRNC